MIDIETFLEVVRTGNITHAAENLFLSQSTVSNRIKSLEDELDTVLMNRKKGIRSISLTPSGEQFISIAEQWLLFWKSTKNIIKNEQDYSLTIGSPDSLNTYVLAPLFKSFAESKLSSSFIIKTHQSNEIHSLLQNHDIDIGFVFYPLNYKNILSRPIFKEKMFIICKKSGYYKKYKLHPHDLNPKHEILLEWSYDIKYWHNTWWDSNINPYVHVDTPTLIINFLDNDQLWAMCPESIVQSLISNNNIEIHEFTELPPERICYIIEHRYPNPSNVQAIKMFKKQLDEFGSNLKWYLK